MADRRDEGLFGAVPACRGASLRPVAPKNAGGNGGERSSGRFRGRGKRSGCVFAAGFRQLVWWRAVSMVESPVGRGPGGVLCAVA